MESQLGPLLRRFRSATGLTQEALAQQAGLSARAVSSLESGARRFPQQPTLGAIADALGLDTDQRQALALAATRPSRRARPDPGDLRDLPLPRQLPPTTADFTGRAEELQTLTELLSRSAALPLAVPVAAITGVGGVGKTALAVQVGHTVAAHYPDGQLYVDLRGFGPGPPVTPTDALLGFLRALGTGSHNIGNDPATLAVRFRSMLADRRILMVLDNAQDAAHVEHLLPGTAGGAAIVTSRQSIAMIAGARQLQLDILPEPEAIRLLSAIAGQCRVENESAASTEVVRNCGRLPLAIRVAGARLAARPSWSVAQLAAWLATESRRRDELDIGEVGTLAARGLVDEGGRHLDAATEVVERHRASNAADIRTLLGGATSTPRSTAEGN